MEAQRAFALLLLCLAAATAMVSGAPASNGAMQEFLSFNCPTIASPNETATSVHRLHAGDIKVLMAMGDSITAGFGMMGEHGNLGQDLLEYRGQSWLIGADPDAQTLATFFQNYNSRLVGGSVGQHEAEICWGNVCPEKQMPAKDNLNSAMSGAMMYDFVNGWGNQVKYLVAQLEAKREIVDMERDWKLVSIFVGANDMCVQCEEVNIQPTSVDDYEKYFRQALQELRAQVPRLLVNVGLLFNVSQIYKLSLQVPHCANIHRLLPEECLCAFKAGAEGDRHRAAMDATAVAYNERLVKVAREFSSNASAGDQGFTVVIQPAMRDGNLGHFPLSFISTLDCFHPSLEAHQMMAKVMWNGLWTPAAQKKSTFDYLAPFVCPTAESTIPTG